jgi:ribosomal protein S18 acetylase RimI-like enzyme
VQGDLAWPLVVVRVEPVPASAAAELVGALKDWEPPGCYVAGLHVGDVGWKLRLGDDGDGLVGVRDGSELVAVAVRDSAAALRPRTHPDRVHDMAIASALLEYVDAMPRDAPAFVDADGGSALRSLLSGAGWQLDPDPWVALYRPLTVDDADVDDPLTTRLRNDEDVADRVAVQRAAFAGSTFTVTRWHQMAAGPGFDPAFEFLRRTVDGVPVAAATGWSAGPGKCAILEPVGAHPEHSGVGHGRAVSQAVIGALARSGASGVTVHTPASNSAAVRTYESCGLRQVDVTQAMMRPAAQPTREDR